MLPSTMDNIEPDGILEVSLVNETPRDCALTGLPTVWRDEMPDEYAEVQITRKSGKEQIYNIWKRMDFATR